MQAQFLCYSYMFYFVGISLFVCLFRFLMWSISTDTRSNLNSNYLWEENRANTGGGTNNVHTGRNTIWFLRERCTDKPKHKMKNNTRQVAAFQLASKGIANFSTMLPTMTRSHRPLPSSTLHVMWMSLITQSRWKIKLKNGKFSRLITRLFPCTLNIVTSEGEKWHSTSYFMLTFTHTLWGQ